MTTVIVLLILAGVTVATLTGENGLLAKAQLAKERNIEAEQDEKDKLSSYENELSNYSASTTGYRDYESQISALTARIEELENANSYSSSDPIRIGTWIGGKPIYRIVFHDTTARSIAKGDSITMGTISDLETVTNSYVLTAGNDGENQENNTWFAVRFRNSDKSIFVQALQGGYDNVSRMDVVVEYTKTSTTPTAQSED